jgi:hypothetical protein
VAPLVIFWFITLDLKRGKLNDLITIFPIYNEINNIIGRLDLMIPFQKNGITPPSEEVTQLNMYYQHWFQNSHTKI